MHFQDLSQASEGLKCLTEDFCVYHYLYQLDCTQIPCNLFVDPALPFHLLNGKCYAERHTEPNLPREVIVENIGSDEREAESIDESSSSDESSSEEDNDE